MTTPQAKRTERPLHVGDNDDQIIYDSRGALMARVYGDSAREATANAAHLALCWNSHADLVAALKWLISEIRPFASDNGPREAALDNALKALAKSTPTP